MIRFSLVCGDGHTFEGWFASSAEFGSQQERGLLSCPECGNADVKKGLMTPSVRSKRSEPVPEDKAAGVPVARMSPDSAEMRDVVNKLRELRKVVIANTEDVGNRFGEEARKIHYGESEARGIRGQTDLKEAAKLLEEGIDILPVPQLPEDKN